jgi:hypothetical protein
MAKMNASDPKQAGTTNKNTTGTLLFIFKK